MVGESVQFYTDVYLLKEKKKKKNWSSFVIEKYFPSPAICISF